MSLQASESSYLDSLIAGASDAHGVGMATGVLQVYFRWGRFDDCGALYMDYSNRIYKAALRVTVRQFGESMDEPEKLSDGLPCGFDDAFQLLIFDDS